MPEAATLPPTGPTPSIDDALALGLTREEYELVCEKQGRPPNLLDVEWGAILSFRAKQHLIPTRRPSNFRATGSLSLTSSWARSAS